MEITLPTVRTVLRKALGFESFTARFIERIIPDPSVETAAISKDGTLSYNPSFVNESIKSEADLFSLIFHETLHHVFGHFIYKTGPIENIAADAIINAAISVLYSDHSSEGELFQRLYPHTGLPAILRPNSDLGNSALQELYETLYNSRRYYHQPKISTGELIRILRIILPKGQTLSVLFLGDHTGREQANLPAETIASIAGDIKQSLKHARGNAGYSNVLKSLFVEVLDSRISLSHKLLERYTTKQKLDRFKERGQVRQRTTSPIPLNPSKRDMTLLAAGCWPGYFHNRHSRPSQHNTGCAIYLDVSGSVQEHLPAIIGVIAKLSSEIPTLYLFSNTVVETTMKDLIRGAISTTGGTDFDCIAESILEKNYDKAVIITDGYARLGSDLSEELKTRNTSILTILFGGRDNCHEFETFGDVVQLKDIH